MKKLGWFGFIIIVGAIVFLMNSFFTVRQDSQVLLLEFGAPIGSINAPGTDQAGLHFKMPWQTTEYLEKRNLGYNIPEIKVLASDQRQLIVDAFVRWQIKDPLQYYQRLRTEDIAVNRLKTFVEPAIRNALARLPVPEIVSGQRSQLMDEIRQKVNEDMSEFGLDIIDVRIRQADLPDSIAESVYSRMMTARTQEAQRIRSVGEEEAQLIRATANKERTVLEARAREQAEIIRGEGDAKRNKIYADAYNQDTEFFSFQRGLIACENSMTRGTQLVIDPSDVGICDQFIAAARRSSR